jgi:hypothetical protein
MLGISNFQLTLPPSLGEEIRKVTSRRGFKRGFYLMIKASEGLINIYDRY